jgi:pilus assembly protein CpaF
METLKLATGDVLFQQGDPAEALYLVLSGMVEWRDPEKNYTEILGPGTVVGESEALSGGIRKTTASALTESEVQVVPRGRIADQGEWLEPLLRKMARRAKPASDAAQKPTSVEEALVQVSQTVSSAVQAFQQQNIAFQERFERLLPKPKKEEELKLGLRDVTVDFGPITPLIEDGAINDILINRYDQVYIERFGKLERTSIVFPNDDAVLKLAYAIVDAVGRDINPHRPVVDARLLDGSRVNVIAPPLAVDGTCISIRKFSEKKLTLDHMIEQKNMSPAIGSMLKVISKCRLNVLISGGTGAGKTTLLNAISQHIDHSERIVTVEDAAELQLQQPHVVRLETKPLSYRGNPGDEVNIRDLVRNALRMRPDRIIVGEVRGHEAFDMMQAMNTGHEGSMSTIHSNHPRDALSRLENMIGMANMNIPAKAMRYQVASALNVIVQISRMRDGVRRIRQITEIAGMEGEQITMHDLFTYDQKGEDSDGNIIGDFKWSKITPRFVRRVGYYGLHDELEQALGVRLPKM